MRKIKKIINNTEHIKFFVIFYQYRIILIAEEKHHSESSCSSTLVIVFPFNSLGSKVYAYASIKGVNRKTYQR